MTNTSELVDALIESGVKYDHKKTLRYLERTRKKHRLPKLDRMGEKRIHDYEYTDHELASIFDALLKTIGGKDNFALNMRRGGFTEQTINSVINRCMSREQYLDNLYDK